MSIKITHDDAAPAASIELMITKPLSDYDLENVEAAVPREVDPILASQGFKDLLDEARSIVERDLIRASLEITQLTGAICRDRDVYRPGIWLVLRENGAENRGVKGMSSDARAKVAGIAETLRADLGLS
jgi:hypothetical protein